MKLFIWRNTECNRLYSAGDIVAMAPDLDAAKAAVLEAAKTAMVGYCDMASLASSAEGTTDYSADCRDEFAFTLGKVRTDLEREPEVFEAAAAAFFNGGE